MQPARVPDGVPADRVLVLDPDPVSLAEIVGEIGGVADAEVVACSEAARALEIARGPGVVLMILDVKTRGGESETPLSGLQRFREACPSAALIVLTTYADTDDLYQIFRVEGVRKYLLKPWKKTYAAEVSEVLDRWREARAGEEERLRLAEERERLARENEGLRIRARENHPWDLVVARSPRMGEAWLRARAQAASERSVILTGEGGTGKRLLARLIHYNGPRGSGPLAEMNGAIFRGGVKGGIDPDPRPEKNDRAPQPSLAEEIVRAKWEVAGGGTFLVCQLDELPDSLQDLLAGLIGGSVGDREGGGVSARGRAPSPPPRVLATASDGYGVMALDGRITPSLHRALDPVQIDVPPLRERSLDIADLALRLARTFGESHGRTVLGLADDALALLCEHGFPGNVTELECLVERAVAQMAGPVIEVVDLKIP